MKLVPGMKTAPFCIEVTREAVKRFAKCVYFHNDTEDDTIVPPTLPITFWNEVKIDWLSKFSKPVIHGKQSFFYQQPILVGKVYTCTITLKKITEKQGKRGRMLILDHELEGRQGESLHFTSSTTLIVYP
ncbi:FAS1-like dehydratase domain-containing protein [Bacillus vallismortis]|uniref:FAS1-like dehydratase domain-containing protein n=1 Tax=Bacillus vallismortis TaxID=72361 RepID=UPI0020914E40|nr:MaoC family dehydratase N-terminal domain-containing protein [Bacillus vallismortis]MCO4852518.1 MaoC family dehydratase N-terminal domain-containing protein [Bacillus vallismortis]